MKYTKQPKSIDLLNFLKSKAMKYNMTKTIHKLNMALQKTSNQFTDT